MNSPLAWQTVASLVAREHELRLSSLVVLFEPVSDYSSHRMPQEAWVFSMSARSRHTAGKRASSFWIIPDAFGAVPVVSMRFDKEKGWKKKDRRKSPPKKKKSTYARENIPSLRVRMIVWMCVRMLAGCARSKPS